MKIFYVRHGQTDWNLEQRMQGGQTDNPLNGTGIQQAEETRELLKNIKYDIVIRSPMLRAKQTAEIINQDRDVEIIVDERLRERKLGQSEGDPVTPEREKQIWDYELNIDLKGGENLKEFEDRIIDFIQDIKIKYQDKTVLIVAHGGIAKVLKAYLYGKPKSNNLNEIEVKNCEIIEAELN